MKEKVSKKFQEIYGSGAILFASPGRINLIGEHTCLLYTSDAADE